MCAVDREQKELRVAAHGDDLALLGKVKSLEWFKGANSRSRAKGRWKEASYEQRGC